MNQYLFFIRCILFLILFNTTFTKDLFKSTEKALEKTGKGFKKAGEELGTAFNWEINVKNNTPYTIYTSNLVVTPDEQYKIGEKTAEWILTVATLFVGGGEAAAAGETAATAGAEEGAVAAEELAVAAPETIEPVATAVSPEAQPIGTVSSESTQPIAAAKTSKFAPRVKVEKIGGTTETFPVQLPSKEPTGTYFKPETTRIARKGVIPKDELPEAYLQKQAALEQQKFQEKVLSGEAIDIKKIGQTDLPTPLKIAPKERQAASIPGTEQKMFIRKPVKKVGFKTEETQLFHQDQPAQTVTPQYRSPHAPSPLQKSALKKTVATPLTEAPPTSSVSKIEPSTAMPEEVLSPSLLPRATMESADAVPEGHIVEKAITIAKPVEAVPKPTPASLGKEPVTHIPLTKPRPAAAPLGIKISKEVATELLKEGAIEQANPEIMKKEKIAK